MGHPVSKGYSCESDKTVLTVPLKINVYLYTLSSVRLIAQLLWDKKSSHRTEARELRPEDTDDRAPETRAPRKRPPRPCTGIRNFCTKYVAIESVF